MHRQSSGNCGFVRNQEEVKQFISLILNQTSIHTGAWSRIQVVLVIWALLEQSVVDLLIHKTVHDLGIVVGSILLSYELNHFLNLESLNLFLEGGASNSVPIDENVVGIRSIALLLMLVQSFSDQVNQDLSSVLCSLLLLNILSCSSNQLSLHILVNNL